MARRFFSGAGPAVGEGAGGAGEEPGDAAGGRAVGVGVPAAGHGTADGAGEVAVGVGEGGGDQGGVGDGVDPVVRGAWVAWSSSTTVVEVAVAIGPSRMPWRTAWARRERGGTTVRPVRRQAWISWVPVAAAAMVAAVNIAAVDAVGGVGEGGVAVGLFGGGGRVAGVGPAVDVGADQGADPLAERVAVAGGERGFEAGEEVAVGDAFGGEGAARGEFVQPEPRHVGGGEAACRGAGAGGG